MNEYVKTFLEQRTKPIVAKGDFTKDGILFCGTCGEPKQAWIDWLPDADGNVEKKLVPVMCQCAVEREKKEKDDMERDRFRESLRHFNLSIRGNEAFSASTFQNDDSPDSSISRACRKYVEQWKEMREDNIGILFYGSKGTGKTYYAECIVNAMIEKGIVAVMTTTANLMNVLSGFDRTETMDAIYRVPLLALDDLGAERDTSYSAELMYSVIDTRCKAGKPTIVTTNLDLEEMKHEEDLWRARIYDRVIEMCPIAIPMVGKSRRSANADIRKQKAREILGGKT